MALDYGVSGSNNGGVQIAHNQGVVNITRPAKHEEQWRADLYGADPRTIKKEIEDRRGGLLPELCEWIIDHLTFTEFLANPSGGLLWIKGDAGKGKTMLMCGIVNELEKQKRALSFFFCEQPDNNLNNATAVLRGLLFILESEHPRIREYLSSWPDKCRDYWVSLKEMFEGLIQASELDHIILLVDALDECTKDQGKLLQFISKTTRYDSKVKWIVCSRHVRSVEVNLGTGPNHVELLLESNPVSVSTAVDLFIDHTVKEMTKPKDNFPPDVTEQVTEHLKQHADGTFLWVAFVRDGLLEAEYWDAVDLLEELPAGLIQYYERMWEDLARLKGGSRRICLEILAVALLVNRPLHFQEMQSLLSVPENLKQELKVFLKMCGSFLVVRQDVLHFVHLTAKEFLLRRALSQDTEMQIHYSISKQSIEALPEATQRDLCGIGEPEAHRKRFRYQPMIPLLRLVIPALIGLTTYMSANLHLRGQGFVTYPTTALSTTIWRPITSYAFSPDQQKIVPGDEEPAIKIWDAKSGTCQKTMSVRNMMSLREPTAVTFSGNKYGTP